MSTYLLWSTDENFIKIEHAVLNLESKHKWENVLKKDYRDTSLFKALYETHGEVAFNVIAYNEEPIYYPSYVRDEYHYVGTIYCLMMLDEDRTTFKLYFDWAICFADERWFFSDDEVDLAGEIEEYGEYLMEGNEKEKKVGRSFKRNCLKIEDYFFDSFERMIKEAEEELRNAGLNLSEDTIN